MGDLDNNGTLDFVFPNTANNVVAVRLNSQVLAAASAQLAGQVSLYPNPAHDAIQLRLPAELANQSVQLRVYTVLGQVVLEQNLAAQPVTQVRLPELPAGAYNVRLGTRQGSISKRLLIK